MAAFIDAFLIGDGEEAVLNTKCILSVERRGADNKTSLLQALSKIGGVYVPALGKKSR